MYSTHNEGKSVVAERFIRTSKNKIYKYMASISKNVYIDKLDDIVNKYNDKYYRTIKMKPINIKSETYINSSKETYDKNPKYKVGDIARISKYKNVFGKGYVPNCLKKFLCIKKLKTLFHVHTLLVILMLKKLLEHFTKKNCKKQIKKSLELKRKGDKLYVTGKAATVYDS